MTFHLSGVIAACSLNRRNSNGGSSYERTHSVSQRETQNPTRERRIQSDSQVWRARSVFSPDETLPSPARANGVRGRQRRQRSASAQRAKDGSRFAPLTLDPGGIIYASSFMKLIRYAQRRQLIRIAKKGGKIPFRNTDPRRQLG